MHEPRLTQALRTLLHEQRVAALGTLSPQAQPFVSMVPYALDPEVGCLLILVSQLAAHSRHLRNQPMASLLVTETPTPQGPVHALARATLSVHAHMLEPDDPQAPIVRRHYLARFPEAEPIAQLGDFRWVRLHPEGARQVAGFGAARDVDAPTLRALLRAAAPAPA